jgi:TrmH family RNA methyltransferase
VSEALSGTATYIASAANPLIKELRKLSQDSTAYRKQGRLWLEGDHLCRAALASGRKPVLAVFSESYWPLAQAEWARAAIKNIVIADSMLPGISSLESPAQMGFVLELPADQSLLPGVASVILDRVQDAGNVGSILRSAAAFGVVQIIALKGTAALWSPKVLRAGMGAHFSLRLVESVEAAQLDRLESPMVVTSSHEGVALHRQKLPVPCAWVMGHEGQGVSHELVARASHTVRIEQPGGEESLNVAAAAAICLYASSLAAPPSPEFCRRAGDNSTQGMTVVTR